MNLVVRLMRLFRFHSCGVSSNPPSNSRRSLHSSRTKHEDFKALSQDMLVLASASENDAVSPQDRQESSI